MTRICIHKLLPKSLLVVCLENHNESVSWVTTLNLSPKNNCFLTEWIDYHRIIFQRIRFPAIIPLLSTPSRFS